MTSTTVVAHGGALDGWLAQRRALGQDVHDEVWEGTYHVAPHAPAEHARLALRLLMGLGATAAAANLEGLGEFNLGVNDDYRVPDFAWVRRGVDVPLLVPTAVICGEVVSPGDAGFQKVPFSLSRGVQEIWWVEPVDHRVTIATPAGNVDRSAALGIRLDSLPGHLGWT